jgi:hypothetical protein
LNHLPTLVLRSSPLGSANFDSSDPKRTVRHLLRKANITDANTPKNERGRKVKRPLNRGIRKKSARFASTALNEPIGAAANQETREGSASSGAGSGVKTAVLVAKHTAFVTALIDPVVRRHETAVEDRANRHGRPYYQKKEKQLQLGEEHSFLQS